MAIGLSLITIDSLIKQEKWDEAFELVKNEVHRKTKEGAELVTKLVKRTKWYDQGLALLSLNKDTEPVYMDEYLKVCKLQTLERSRLSLWSKLRGPSLLDDPEDLTDNSESELDEEDLEEEDLDEVGEPLVKTLEHEMRNLEMDLHVDDIPHEHDQISIELPQILEVVGQKIFPDNCCNRLQVPVQTPP